jgi:MFS family permease
MLWFICFFNYADRQALSAVLPLLHKRFGFSKEEQGLIAAAFTWTYALAAPWAGQTSDRFPRKAVVLAGLTIWSAVTGFTAVCVKLWQFVMVRGAEGLGETFYFPASMSMVADYHGARTRSRAMSLHQTGVYAGTIGGSAFAGWVGMHLGWQWPFVILGALGVGLGVVLASFLKEPARSQDPQEAGRPTGAELTAFLRHLSTTPTAILLMAAFFGANFVALVFLTWMPTFLTEKFHLDLAKAGLGATFYIQTASMVGAAAGGWIADRWRRSRPGGRMLSQALGALLGGPFIYLCGFTRELAGLMVAMTLFGLTKGLYDANIWASLYDVVPARHRGAAVGVANMVGWLGGGLGAYMIGRAVTRWHFTMSQAISSTATIYLGVAALLLTAGFVFAPRDIRAAEAAAA